MKIVINRCFGGFGLSDEGIEHYNAQDPDGPKGSHYNIERDDPRLVKTVEELGVAANFSFAALTVVEVPDDVNWTIEDYDGMEHVAEVHRTWR